MNKFTWRAAGARFFILRQIEGMRFERRWNSNIRTEVPCCCLAFRVRENSLFVCQTTSGRRLQTNRKVHSHISNSPFSASAPQIDANRRQLIADETDILSACARYFVRRLRPVTPPRYPHPHCYLGNVMPRQLTWLGMPARKCGVGNMVWVSGRPGQVHIYKNIS